MEHLPPTVQKILWFNPLTHIIDFAHNFMLYEIYPDLNSIFYLILTTLVISIIGIVIFRNYNPGITEEL